VNHSKVLETTLDLVLSYSLEGHDTTDIFTLFLFKFTFEQLAQLVNARLFTTLVPG